MKKLYLVRHAKSSWKYPETPDHDRPLNKRGKRDAPFMGELLFKKGEEPEVLITSSAQRAFATARTFARELNYPPNKIIKEREIYEADTNDLLMIIGKIDNQFESAMLFGHNPGFTLLNNLLTDTHIDNIPTCSIVIIELDIKDWNDVSYDCGKVIAFEYPKKYSI